MRFAAVAVLAGVAAANTVYQTDYVTITSCGPEVPNCPASSTVTYSSTYAVSTTSPAEEYPTYPAETETASSPAAEYPTHPVETSSTKPVQSYPVQTPSVPVEYPVQSVSTKPVESASTKPVQSVPVYPTQGVSTSVVTYSTCVPTVSYSTVTIYPTGSVPATYPVGPTGGVPPVHPTGGYPTHSAPPSYPTVPVAGAPKMAGSVLLAAAAGVAAVILA